MYEKRLSVISKSMVFDLSPDLQHLIGHLRDGHGQTNERMYEYDCYFKSTNRNKAILKLLNVERKVKAHSFFFSPGIKRRVD